MPKGRGRKGSQQPRKRKAYTSIETHLENPALASNTSDTTDTTHLTPPQFQLPSPLHQPQPNYPLSPYCHSTQPHAYPTEQFWHTTPFTLCKISGNISTCVGCRNKYTKTAPPPDDMCIRHQQWREFMPQGSPIPNTRFGNVYYHFNPTCIWQRCSWFVRSQLVVPSEIDSFLIQSHTRRGWQPFFIFIIE